MMDSSPAPHFFGVPATGSDPDSALYPFFSSDDTILNFLFHFIFVSFQSTPSQAAPVLSLYRATTLTGLHFTRVLFASLRSCWFRRLKLSPKNPIFHLTRHTQQHHKRLPSTQSSCSYLQTRHASSSSTWRSPLTSEQIHPRIFRVKSIMSRPRAVAPAIEKLSQRYHRTKRTVR